MHLVNSLCRTKMLLLNKGLGFLTSNQTALKCPAPVSLTYKNTWTSTQRPQVLAYTQGQRLEPTAVWVFPLRSKTTVDVM